MKPIYLFLFALIFVQNQSLTAQKSQSISTYDFVQIIEDNQEEALYYYENNWKVARELGVEKGFIDSFQLLETKANEESPFHIILITTYKDSLQYGLREENFEKLFTIRGEVKLLNQKRPEDFRKIISGTESTQHRRFIGD